MNWAITDSGGGKAVFSTSRDHENCDHEGDHQRQYSGGQTPPPDPVQQAQAEDDAP